MIELPKSIVEKTSAAINGQSEALGIVFQFYRPRLLAHAIRICGNTPIAQDAVQDTFIAAFTKLSSLREASLFYPWLKKILINTCYRLLRRERSTELTPAIIQSDSLLNQSVEDHFETVSNRQLLFDALRNLSEELRSCVVLRYFSMYQSYDEIAIILNIPVGTVRSRLAAAREKLANLFSQKEDSGDAALRESNQWSEYYFNQYSKIHSSLEIRNQFFDHFQPSFKIRFTSGMQGFGIPILEKEINNDLFFGSRFSPTEVISSGNMSVIELVNFNHPDYPDRCAPGTAIVLFRNNEKVEHAHIFDSPRG